MYFVIFIQFSISPLSSSMLYVYRGVKNNILTIDESQLDTIIKNECGKSELKRLKTVEMKRKFITVFLHCSHHHIRHALFQVVCDDFF